LKEMIDFLLNSSLALVLILFVVQTVRLWRRERQFQALAGSLEHKEKMATMGHLLAGIAHELKTPLGAVSCSLDTARRGLGKMGEALEEIENSPLEAGAADSLARAKKALNVVQGNEPVLDQALTRTGQLVRQLRLIGRGDKEEPVTVDVNALIEGSLILLSHELKNDVSVDLQLGDVPEVEGWPGPLGQVFLNLILNAQQAIEGPGRVTVFSGVENGKVVVKVSDTGSGLPAGFMDKVFSPGWTTKSEEDGTGLGLFISKRIVERHSGRIEAGNAEAGGAVFVVTLPPAVEGTSEAGA
jgi:two-component system NtrC family sensor kinase